jgi:hypothetical protein
VRNSYTNGTWDGEERDQPHFPFAEGKSFTVRIDVTHDRYIVYVGGKHFVEYGHRLDLNRGHYLILADGAEYYDVVFNEKRVSSHVYIWGKKLSLVNRRNTNR